MYITFDTLENYVLITFHISSTPLPFTAHRLNFSRRKACKPKTSVLWYIGTTFKIFSGISDLLSKVCKFQHHKIYAPSLHFSTNLHCTSLQTFTPLHYNLHPTLLQTFTPLHYNPQFTLLQTFTPLHYNLHSTSLQTFTPLHYNLHSTSVQPSLHFTTPSLHFITNLHSASLHLHYTSLHWTPLHYIHKIKVC